MTTKADLVNNILALEPEDLAKWCIGGYVTTDGRYPHNIMSDLDLPLLQSILREWQMQNEFEGAKHET